MLKKWYSIAVLFVLSAVVFTCSTNINEKGADTATYGTIKIASDESFQPLVDAELDVFHALYQYAKVGIVYKPEDAAIDEMLKDSVRLVFTTRQLNEREKAVFDAAKITPRVNKVAIDGVALIVNNANMDSMLTMKQLKSIFKGEATDWKQFSKLNNSGSIQIVFDNGNSSNLRYISDKFACDSTDRKRFFSAGGNKEVVDYVKNNKGALGVIGVNWISDGDDSTSKSFTNTVKVVAVSDKENPKKSEYYQPYQAYMAQNWYPLSRELFVISREARVGLGTGFAAFVVSDRGQRIVLKSGLVPANVPLRIVNVKNKMP